MHDRKKLSEEHAALIEASDALMTLLRAPAPDLVALDRLRWRMMRVLLLHLAQEDHLMYPRLRSSPDPLTREIAERFQREMGDLATNYRAYALRWGASAIAADWNGFRTESRKIIAALQRRIRREETELYPRIASAA